MKKVISVFITALLLLSFVACGNMNDNSKTSETTTENNSGSESNAPAAIAGGWTVNTELTDEAKEIFNNAVTESEDIKYEPIAFSTQVVNGMNYCFICKATEGAKEYFAKVCINMPIKGNPEITEITVI